MPIRIGDREIGVGPPFVIAEAGVNHNGDVDLALALVDAAADAGADAVKFQTFQADALVTAEAPQAEYQRIRSASSGQRSMLAAMELSPTELARVRARAVHRGIVFLSTPFDLSSLDLLIALDVPAVKIGSGDLTNALLLRAVSRVGRPLLLSTGMATVADIRAALQIVADVPTVLLQCTSAYPCPVGDANVRAIPALRDEFGCEVGFSDHTPGIAAALAATALGASVIEKHLTLDRSLPGPDHAASLEPSAFGELVAGVRDAHQALGNGVKAPRPVEYEMLHVARRSLVLRADYPAGHVLEVSDLDAKRPGTGISPMDVDRVVGRRLARDVNADIPLHERDLI
jgi:N-acetylneuraminate synthase/N,N'-diacetyllegionaminate synthase